MPRLRGPLLKVQMVQSHLPALTLWVGSPRICGQFLPGHDRVGAQGGRPEGPWPGRKGPTRLASSSSELSPAPGSAGRPGAGTRPPRVGPPACTARLHAGRALTLQAVELARAVLPGDVLPVGAAGQGHHGAQRGRPLAHLHLQLQGKNRVSATGRGGPDWDSAQGERPALVGLGLCRRLRSPSRNSW